MNDQLMLLISQLGKFLIMILCGYIAIRLKWLDPGDFDVIARLVVKMLLPIYMLTTVPAAGTRADLIASLPLLLAAFSSVVILLLLGRLGARILRLPDKTARAFTVCSGISNIGFMGIPLGGALFGAPGILGASMYALANDASLWTLGKLILYGRPAGDNGKSAKPARNTKWWRRWLYFFNPGICSILLGLILLALEFNPAGNVVWDALTSLGGMARYLPMIFIGGMLATFDVGRLRHYISVSLIVLIKMIVVPLGVHYLSLLLMPGLSATNRTMLIIGVALPTFASSSAIAATFGADEQYAAACVIITTLACLLTLPFVLYLIGI